MLEIKPRNYEITTFKIINQNDMQFLNVVGIFSRAKEKRNFQTTPNKRRIISLCRLYNINCAIYPSNEDKNDHHCLLTCGIVTQQLQWLIAVNASES